MYRLMLFFLATLVGASILFSQFGVLSFSPGAIAYQAIYLLAVCWSSNFILARIFKVSANSESSLITALILTLIVGPVLVFSSFLFLTLAGVASIASKYILKFDNRHIFNPAAFGVVFTALVLGESASWWIGGIQLLPLVALGGILIAQKTGRWHLVLGFLAVYTVGFAALFVRDFSSLFSQIRDLFVFSPILFFAFVMLIEPLTAPPSRFSRVLYGAFIGTVILSFHAFFSAIPYSIELSLLIGNAVARAFSPGGRMNLSLLKSEKIGADTWTFWFDPDRRAKFVPGQYIEATLSHGHPDSRGVRRFFTVSSSPSEDNILITTRIIEKSSSFKKALKDFRKGSFVAASLPRGEFVMPPDRKVPIAFIAGGIGVTPFRSMVKYLVDKNEKRDIVLLYSNRTKADIVFEDIFLKGEKIGLKIVYTLTDESPQDWGGRLGIIDREFIRREVPDFMDRMFYVSGPSGMVKAFEKILHDMGVPDNQVKHDYFPGY